MKLFLYRLFTSLFFDPFIILRNWRALPSFVSNIMRYKKANKNNDKFKFDLFGIFFSTKDKYLSSGSIDSHYFNQDLWAAREVYKSGVQKHIDVGSRIDGFVSHVLTFCDVEYVDIRDLNYKVPRLSVKIGSITQLPYEDNSITSLSCLHVIEHIGLGRYGDEIDPTGYLKGIAELSRVLAPSSRLYFGTPVGKERVEFDAHRVFNTNTIIDAFKENDVKLKEFHLIDDKGLGINFNSSFSDANLCKYGCGLFVFEK